MAEGRIWLGLAAACSILALGLLIGSVFLAQHGWLLVGMVVPLVIVLLGHVFSCVACAVVLYKAGKKMGVRSRWLFGAILAISVSSVGGCVAVATRGLAALQEDHDGYDGYDGFLAVSVDCPAAGVKLIALRRLCSSRVYQRCWPGSSTRSGIAGPGRLPNPTAHHRFHTAVILVGRNPVHRAQIATGGRTGSSSKATGPPALLRTSWT